jgi:hypothetical protein
MKWIKLQSPSRELTLWGAYAGRFQYTLSYHSGAVNGHLIIALRKPRLAVARARIDGWLKRQPPFSNT